jgi:hypothetical protein
MENILRIKAFFAQSFFADYDIFRIFVLSNHGVDRF